MGLRILFLSHSFSPDIGGIEINSEILAGEFVRKGHSVHLLTWSLDSSHRKFPFKVIRNPGKYLLIKEHLWCDVVFENNPCLKLSWPRLFIPRPSVIALNTWISRPDGSMEIRDSLKRQWLKNTTKVIAVSESVRKRSFNNSVVIGNPYKADEFKVLPNVERNRDFVFLGRLVSDKGADLAIKALYELSGILQNDNISAFMPTLTIIGDGPEKKNLLMLANDLELDKQVCFTGTLVGKDLTACLNQHKFMLVPSIWQEPFGNVVLEGIGCGCLPIVSDGGGLPSAVGKAGLIFQRGNINSLVKCMLDIIKDPKLEKILRDAATDHLKDHSPGKVANKYLEVIDEALTGRQHFKES